MKPVVILHPKMFTPTTYLDLQRTEHRTLFDSAERVWEALPKIGDYLHKVLKPEFRGKRIGEPFIGEQVFVGEGTIIEHGALIKGPAWIGKNCRIRAGCYIRENVVLGDGVVAGNSCEFKNCLIFDECEVPHFNYVGDSILGYKAHLGAGVILSNVKLTRDLIALRGLNGETINTGLRKFGAIIGDRTEIGCNAVINPGSLIGRDCFLYPGIQWHGILKENSIVKFKQEIQIVERHR